MKQDLRMNAKSPDPDDLARQELPQPEVDESAGVKRGLAEPSQPDRSAPHIPPAEKGRITGE